MTQLMDPRVDLRQSILNVTQVKDPGTGSVCESEHHETHALHAGPATHLQVGFCVHTIGLRCAPIVKLIMADPKPSTCPHCKVKGMATFIPLPEGGN